MKYTVIAILEAKADKVNELEAALTDVLTKSRAEDSNLEYRLHKSADVPGQFILYENWVSQEKHQEQFNKSYIIELVAQLETLLAKPYQAFFANELNMLESIA